MSTVRPGLYLVIARYNAESWKQWKEWKSSSSIKEDERARDLARKLFPIEKSIDFENDGSVEIPGLGPVRLLRTFYTGYHDQIVQKVGGLRAREAGGSGYGEHMKEISSKELKKATEELFAHPPRDLPNLDEYDPGIGWMALFEEETYLKFLDLADNKTAPFWQLYSIEVIPLNNDQSTADFYRDMTPTNWRT